MSAAAPLYSVVVPTVGRPSLATLLDGLAGQRGPRPQEVVVVDDRPDPSPTLLERSSWPYPLRVVRGWGRGPAAARNLGWRLTTTEWVEFLDDDVVLPTGWARTLAVDLAAAPARRRRLPGPDPGPAADEPPAHRLGALDGRAGVGPVGHGRHGLPALGAARRRRLRRALPPRLPRGRRPRPAGAPCRAPARRRAARGRSPGAARRPRDERARAAGQRRRRPHAAAPRARLARARRHRPGPVPPAPRRRRWRRLAALVALPLHRSGRRGPRPRGDRWHGLSRPRRRPRAPPRAARAADAGRGRDDGLDERRPAARGRLAPGARLVAPPRRGAVAALAPRGAARPRRHARPRRAVQRRPRAPSPRSTGPARRWTACASDGLRVGVVTNQSGLARGLLTPDQVRCRQRRGRRPARPVRHLAGVPPRARRRLPVPQAAAGDGARRGRAGSACARRSASSSATSVPTPRPRARRVRARCSSPRP